MDYLFLLHFWSAWCELIASFCSTSLRSCCTLPASLALRPPSRFSRHGTVHDLLRIALQFLEHLAKPFCMSFTVTCKAMSLFWSLSICLSRTCRLSRSLFKKKMFAAICRICTSTGKSSCYCTELLVPCLRTFNMFRFDPLLVWFPQGQALLLLAPVVLRPFQKNCSSFWVHTSSSESSLQFGEVCHQLSLPPATFVFHWTLHRHCAEAFVLLLPSLACDGRTTTEFFRHKSCTRPDILSFHLWLALFPRLWCTSLYPTEPLL